MDWSLVLFIAVVAAGAFYIAKTKKDHKNKVYPPRPDRDQDPRY